MGHIGHQVPPLRLQPFQVLGHGVESAGQLAHLAGAGEGHPLGKIALAQPPRRRAQGAYRGQQPPGCQGYQQQAPGSCRQSGPQQGAVNGGGEAAHCRFPGEAGRGGGSNQHRAYLIVPHADGVTAAPPLAPGPAAVPLPLGVADDFAPGVGHQDSTVYQGPGAVQGGLQSGPTLPLGIMAGQQPLDPLDAHFLAAALELVHAPLGGVPHVEADPAQGQGQHPGEGQYCSELEA